MSKVEEIQTIRKALEHNLSQIDGQCSHFSTNGTHSIEQIQKMHERLLTECEDILKELHAQYPNSSVLIDQIKKNAKSAEQVYPHEHVFGDDRVFPIKTWDFWYENLNDEDIFKKRKSFFAFKADLLLLFSEYARFNLVASKNGPVRKMVKKGTDLTHRQNAIINKYKVEAKYISNTFDRIAIREQFGKGREKAFDSVNEHSTTYRPIKAQELKEILPFLTEFPLAQKAAINDLDKLN